MAFKKGAVDLSPYVRKAVAISLIKCYTLDSQQLPILVEIIQLLLKDKSTVVLGPAIGAWKQICPDRFDLLHPHYKKICKLLGESDEWSQIEILDVMNEYCRAHFVDPSLQDLNEDFLLYVNNCKALLSSRNSLVVLKVTEFFYNLGKHEFRELSSKAIMRCMSRPKNEQHMLLVAIREFIIIDPTVWDPFLTYFAIYPEEMAPIISLKFEVLELLASLDNSEWILSEMRSYVRSSNADLVMSAIRTWRFIVMKVPSMAQATLEVLISLLSHPDETIVGESIIVIRSLLQTKGTENDKDHDKLITYLITIYHTITVPLAKASILWLIGHHLDTCVHALDALRIALKTFINEDPFVKKQIMILAVLLSLHTKKQSEWVEGSLDYALKLGKLDEGFDVRDQARFLEACVQSVKEEADFAILKQLIAPPPVSSSVRMAQISEFQVGTLSQFLGYKIDGYISPGEWSNEVKGKQERTVTVKDFNLGNG